MRRNPQSSGALSIGAEASPRIGGFKRAGSNIDLVRADAGEGTLTATPGSDSPSAIQVAGRLGSKRIASSLDLSSLPEAAKDISSLAAQDAPTTAGGNTVLLFHMLKGQAASGSFSNASHHSTSAEAAHASSSPKLGALSVQTKYGPRPLPGQQSNRSDGYHKSASSVSLSSLASGSPTNNQGDSRGLNLSGDAGLASIGGSVPRVRSSLGLSSTSGSTHAHPVKRGSASYPDTRRQVILQPCPYFVKRTRGKGASVAATGRRSLIRAADSDGQRSQSAGNSPVHSRVSSSPGVMLNADEGIALPADMEQLARELFRVAGGAKLISSLVPGGMGSAAAAAAIAKLRRQQQQQREGVDERATAGAKSSPATSSSSSSTPRSGGNGSHGGPNKKQEEEMLLLLRCAQSLFSKGLLAPMKANLKLAATQAEAAATAAAHGALGLSSTAGSAGTSGTASQGPDAASALLTGFARRSTGAPALPGFGHRHQQHHLVQQSQALITKTGSPSFILEAVRKLPMFAAVAHLPSVAAAAGDDAALEEERNAAGSITAPPIVADSQAPAVRRSGRAVAANSRFLGDSENLIAGGGRRGNGGAAGAGVGASASSKDGDGNSAGGLLGSDSDSFIDSEDEGDGSDASNSGHGEGGWGSSSSPASPIAGAPRDCACFPLPRRGLLHAEVQALAAELGFDIFASSSSALSTPAFGSSSGPGGLNQDDDEDEDGASDDEQEGGEAEGQQQASTSRAGPGGRRRSTSKGPQAAASHRRRSGGAAANTGPSEGGATALNAPRPTVPRLVRNRELAKLRRRRQELSKEQLEDRIVCLKAMIALLKSGVTGRFVGAAADLTTSAGDSDALLSWLAASSAASSSASGVAGTVANVKGGRSTVDEPRGPSSLLAVPPSSHAEKPQVAYEPRATAGVTITAAQSGLIPGLLDDDDDEEEEGGMAPALDGHQAGWQLPLPPAVPLPPMAPALPFFAGPLFEDDDDGDDLFGFGLGPPKSSSSSSSAATWNLPAQPPQPPYGLAPVYATASSISGGDTGESASNSSSSYSPRPATISGGGTSHSGSGVVSEEPSHNSSSSSSSDEPYLGYPSPFYPQAAAQPPVSALMPPPVGLPLLLSQEMPFGGGGSPFRSASPYLGAPAVASVVAPTLEQWPANASALSFVPPQQELVGSAAPVSAGDPVPAAPPQAALAITAGPSLTSQAPIGATFPDTADSSAAMEGRAGQGGRGRGRRGRHAAASGAAANVTSSSPPSSGAASVVSKASSRFKSSAPTVPSILDDRALVARLQSLLMLAETQSRSFVNAAVPAGLLAAAKPVGAPAVGDAPNSDGGPRLEAPSFGCTIGTRSRDILAGIASADALEGCWAMDRSAKFVSAARGRSSIQDGQLSSLFRSLQLTEAQQQELAETTNTFSTDVTSSEAAQATALSLQRAFDSIIHPAENKEGSSEEDLVSMVSGAVQHLERLNKACLSAPAPDRTLMASSSSGSLASLASHGSALSLPEMQRQQSTESSASSASSTITSSALLSAEQKGALLFWAERNERRIRCLPFPHCATDVPAAARLPAPSPLLSSSHGPNRSRVQGDHVAAQRPLAASGSQSSLSSSSSYAVLPPSASTSELAAMFSANAGLQQPQSQSYTHRAADGRAGGVAQKVASASVSALSRVASTLSQSESTGKAAATMASSSSAPAIPKAFSPAFFGLGLEAASLAAESGSPLFGGLPLSPALPASAPPFPIGSLPSPSGAAPGATFASLRGFGNPALPHSFTVGITGHPGMANPMRHNPQLGPSLGLPGPAPTSSASQHQQQQLHLLLGGRPQQLQGPSGLSSGAHISASYPAGKTSGSSGE